MRLVRFTILLLVVAGVCGCGSSESLVRDYDLYDTGKPRGEAAYYSEGGFGHSSEYFENGRLKSQQWSRKRTPLIKLAFYENGRLKSEERFFNGQLAYGVYYTEDGGMERTIGRRLNWVSKKGT